MFTVWISARSGVTDSASSRNYFSRATHARRDGAPLAFAGLWDGWRGPDGTVLRTFAIITTPANATMARVHDRMPAILEPGDWPAWLGEAEADPATLLRPAAA